MIPDRGSASYAYAYAYYGKDYSTKTDVPDKMD